MLKKLLGLSKEDLELEISDAEEKFRDLKQKEMDSAEKKADTLKSDIKDAVRQLDEDLSELESFEDSKNRQVINDVVDNVVSDRREMIEDLELPDDPEQLLKDLNQFIADFSDLKDKEAAVLEEAYLDKKLMKYLKPVENQRDKFSSFMENKYRVKTDYHELNQLLDHRKDLLEQKENLKQKIDDKISTDNLEQRKQELEQKLEELNNSSEREHYKDLKQRLEDKESYKRQKISELNSTMNKMERGLKKVIYKAEHGDLSVENTGVLERLRDNKTSKVLANPEETRETVEETVESIPEDLLNDRQHKKFVNAAENLEDLAERSNKIDELEEELKSLKQEINNHEVVEKEERLKSELKQVNKQLKQHKEEREKINKKIEDVKLQITDKQQEIRDHLEKSLDREIKFRN